jgi:hypothetical protein
MKPQPSDSMMAFVWVLGLVTLTSLKAYHVVWVAKGNSSQWLRYLCLGVAQLLVAATVVTGFMLGTLSDYRESVNAWADLAWVFRVTTGMTLATPFLTALVGWHIYRHPATRAST